MPGLGLGDNAFMDVVKERANSLVIPSSSCDAQEIYPFAKDVMISQPSVNIHRHRIGSSWRLKGCKMRKPECVENPKAPTAFTDSAGFR